MRLRQRYMGGQANSESVKQSNCHVVCLVLVLVSFVMFIVVN